MIGGSAMRAVSSMAGRYHEPSAGNALLVHATSVTSPVRLAEPELLHLAGCRAGDGVAELHCCGGLEPGQALFAVGDDVLRADLGAGCSDDECLDGLAPPLIGHADH